ncbi:hypothetical protein QR680_001996 [Steinernema hermaphroditum]|uniref:Nicastrin n=1 Tax=Steinernema hermaphroditum TaxID=289476 RepID=A0AA39LGR3_9BILA|nr:hypothetical protein QR680_001996 [Steinernema hermaphroditum]
MGIADLLLFLLIIHGTLGLYERVTEQVSVELDGFHICYQLLNGTHQTGCQSDQDGNMGIVLYLEDIETIEYYEELCKRGDRCYNFIVVAKFSDLQRKSVEILRSSTVVKGIILTERFSPHAKILSEDASCPNEGFSAYKTNTQWNQNHAIHPAGFRFLNWNKPMFHVENQSDVQIINDNCYRKFNLPDPNSREIHPPFCYAKLTQFMLSAGDARTCARRETLFGGFSQSSSHLCDPIEDENVISVLPPMEITDTDPVEVFLLAARMDAFSALTTDSGGDVSVLTSLIASLAVSEAVGKKMDLFIKEAQKHRRHLMFGFFNGESLGYIGSSRAVWDMQHKRFPAPYNMDYDRNLRPINITNIAVVMELQQIFAVKDRTYYVHTDWNSYITQKDIVDAIAYAAKNGTENVNIVYEEPTQLSQVPPSSCHSFLRENASIPCVVISSFNSRYQYNAVNSMSDRITPADKEQLAAQIKALASSALHASLGFVFNSSDYTTLRSDFSINGTYVDILIDCFIYSENWHTCKMFRDLLSDSKDALNIDEKRVYTGTSTGYINLVKTLVGMLLVQAVGTTKPTKNITSAEQCEALNLEQNVYRYVWLYDASRNASFCYRSSTYLTKAKSPAFEMEDYDWSTNRYSTWTESVWQPPKLTLFLVASDDWPLAIVVAAVVLVLSTIVAWKADEMWFESGPVRNDAAL